MLRMSPLVDQETSPAAATKMTTCGRLSVPSLTMLSSQMQEQIAKDLKLLSSTLRKTPTSVSCGSGTGEKTYGNTEPTSIEDKGDVRQSCAADITPQRKAAAVAAAEAVLGDLVPSNNVLASTPVDLNHNSPDAKLVDITSWILSSY